ncbi:MAG: sugar ABC transporter permease [Finegoldia sp.]|nr:sugar ABC transporter permease [Finegoldia sp.]
MKKEKIYPYLLLLPAFLVVIVLYLYPVVITIFQSFSKVDVVNNSLSYVGFNNYLDLFHDQSFYTSLKITVKYTAITVFLKIMGGFIIAYLLHRNIYLKKTMSFVNLIPWAIPQLVGSTLWAWILDGNYGYLNYYLMKFKLISKPIAFLSKPDTAFYMASFVDAWMGISFVSLMFLSSLEQIPLNLYEASQMDGASKFRQFMDITLPGIKNTFLTVLILVTIWSFNSFNVIYVLTEGGPMRATETLVIKIYEEAFSRFNLGMSSTINVISVLILSILTFLYARRLSYEE